MNEKNNSMQKITTVFSALLVATTLLLAGATAAHAEAKGLNELQKKEVESLVRQYITDNPHVIIEAIQRMQARQEEDKKRQAKMALHENKSELVDDPDAPVGGNLKGDVTIVEFFDYRCGYCKRVFPAIQQVLKDDLNVRYVYKEFPILGPESVAASRISLALWRTDPKKYKSFHAAMMQARGALPAAKVLSIAASVGADAAALKTAMNDPAIETILERNYRLAQSLDINGTPAFVIGGKLVPGAIDIATMKKMIADARGS
jgi:protein-disulfide isomerase